MKVGPLERHEIVDGEYHRVLRPPRDKVGRVYNLASGCEVIC